MQRRARLSIPFALTHKHTFTYTQAMATTTTTRSWACCVSALSFLLLGATATAFVLPASAPSSPQAPQTRMAATKTSMPVEAMGKVLAACSLLLAGAPNLAGAVAMPSPALMTTVALSKPSSSGAGVEVLNDFLRAVKSVKNELTSEKATDLKFVQNAFDVEAVTDAVDGTLDAQMTAAGSGMNQVSIVGKRKIVDKVLRQVLSDVVVVEDTLRDLPPEKTGLARLKKVGKPLGKLEKDLQRLTSALTSDGSEDTAGAAGLAKPLFSLCADGYLLCDPQ